MCCQIYIEQIYDDIDMSAFNEYINLSIDYFDERKLKQEPFASNHFFAMIIIFVLICINSRKFNKRNNRNKVLFNRIVFTLFI